MPNWSSMIPPVGTWTYYVMQISLIVVIVLVVTQFLAWLVRRIMLSPRRLLVRRLSERRRKTLRHLIGSIMNGLAVIIIIVLILAMFIQSSALFTALGLFSAGIGFSAKPYVSDFLGGIVLLFEDQFALGDKVEIGDREVIGTVEQVSLRMTYIRGESGELWLVPNGDVRTIRNFSRGTWSPANIRLTVPTKNLDETLLVLQTLINDPGDDVLEPPEIISEDGEINTDHTTLMLKVKARYGQGPQVRRHLLQSLQSQLTEHHILEDSHA